MQLWPLGTSGLPRNGSIARLELGIRQNRVHQIRYASDKPFTPLRILFCGSDEFSTTSLKRLHAEHTRDQKFIASIDVVCKSGRPSGRGLRKIRDVPIKRAAEDLNLPLHEISTFTGWSPPKPDNAPINLVIAVSFGLLVPLRVLNSAGYGGINLHPSLLPELRGPAPLHHTIMRGIRHTGITLQTLHPQHFDHGTILAQSQLHLPRFAMTAFEALREFLSVPAADLLVDSLRTGVFVPPFSPPDGLPVRAPSHAPKITSEDAHVDWDTWDSKRIMLTQSAIGPLWNYWSYLDKDDKEGAWKRLRIQWHDFEPKSDDCKALSSGLPSTLSTEIQGSYKRYGGIRTYDGVFLSPNSITIEGRKKGWPGDSLRSVEYLLSLALISPEEPWQGDLVEKPTLI